MSKLLEWISLLSAFFAVWYALIGGYTKHPLILEYYSYIMISPLVILIVFILYALVTIIYRVFTFNNCEEAAKELKEQVLEAKKDLHDRGLRW